MATILIIPWFDFSSFSETISLEEIPYNFIFHWNARGSFWVMDIHDNSGNELVNGIKLVLNLELLSKFPDHNLPPGSMYVIDTSGNEVPIAYDDFTNGRCSLVYQTSV
jgi:hypothetical protein